MNVLRTQKLLYEGICIDAWKYKISSGSYLQKMYFICYVRGTTPIILNVSLFSIRLFLAYVYEMLKLVSKVEIKVDALMRENTTFVRKVKKK